MLVHFAPDTPQQRAFTGEEVAKPLQQLVPVLEKEKHQHGDQDHVYQHRQDARDEGHGATYQRLAQLGNFGPGQGRHLVELRRRDQLGIALRQYAQELPALLQHAGHLARQADQLAPHQREHPQGHAKKHPHKQDVGDGYAQPLGHAVPLQLARHALHQEGQHQRRQHRRQDIADGHQQHHGDSQQHQQQDRLLLEQVAPVPFMENI